MLLCRFFCARPGAGRLRFNAHNYSDDYGHPYPDLHPDSPGPDSDRHQYAHLHSHADQYPDKHSYLNSIPHSDAFVHADAFAHSLPDPIVDAEFYQYAHEHPFEYPYADRDSDRHGHAFPIDARYSSISEILDLCFGSFG